MRTRRLLSTNLGKVGTESGGQNWEAFLQDPCLGYPEEDWARLGILKHTEDGEAQGH